MSIKITNAAKIAKIGKFPRTFAAVLAAIPAEVTEALTAKKLAALVDAMDAQFKAGRAAAQKDVADAAIEIKVGEKAPEMTKAPKAKPVAKKYALHNAFDVRDNIKDAGAKWDAGRKAWVANQAMLDKFNARTHTYGMAWLKGWAKVRVEEIAE